jgi:hypothetical protein
VGFTILTPLPGTFYFEQSKAQLKVLDWNQYDLHHLLWKPRLPVERFFELYCETWKRTVLNAAGRKKWWEWARDIDLRHIGHMARILARAQKLMDPQAYLAEFRCAHGLAIAARRENRALLHDSYDEILRRENEFVPVAHSRSPYSYSTSWRSMSACLFFRSNRSSR